MSTAALILAAGEGTRMKSAVPKCAHRVLGEPMVRLVISAALDAGCDPVIVVTGHGADLLEPLLSDVACVRQHERRGTGDAVESARDALTGFSGSLLVLSGDTPLLRPETLAVLVGRREEHGAAVCLLSARMSDPTGYGRIVRSADGSMEAIIEEKDCTAAQSALDEVNTGTYCFDARVLFAHLDRLTGDNAQGELYLTDMVGILRSEGLVVECIVADDALEAIGVNTRVQLAEAAAVLRERVNTAHMLAGVTMTDPSLVWISPRVRLGRDVVLEPMTFLTGDTTVGDGAVIGPASRVEDSRIGPGVVIDSSVLRRVEVAAGATVGPMGFLRPGTVLGANAKTGAFVEVKDSTIGEGSKVPHLSYIGDATLGDEVNIGAGTITCNYDGLHKHETEVGDGAFIGADTMLVAPVRVGARAVTAAGSVITHDVPDDALGVERSEQLVVDGWAARRRARRDGERSGQGNQGD